MEEPELGIEPRIVRRLFNYLCWLGTPRTLGTPAWLGTPNSTMASIDGEWQDYFQRVMKPAAGSDISEPQRAEHQFFVASHSTALLSLCLDNSDLCSVYEFTLGAFDPPDGYKPPVAHVNSPFSDPTGLAFTKVRRVEARPHRLLSNLGASGADILQTNGVVWVEGPSDAIYLAAWLDMYAKETSSPQLLQGQHFQFQIYGGAILDSLSLQEVDAAAIDEENRKLVDMFSFSRNAYVVIDSDAVERADGTIYDKSNFRNAKQFIKAQFEVLNADGYQVGLWYPEGDTQLSTIEDYVPSEIEDAIPPSLGKRPAAERRVALWREQGKTMTDFPKAQPEVAKLYKAIFEWQPS